MARRRRLRRRGLWALLHAGARCAARSGRPAGAADPRVVAFVLLRRGAARAARRAARGGALAPLRARGRPLLARADRRPGGVRGDPPLARAREPRRTSTRRAAIYLAFFSHPTAAERIDGGAPVRADSAARRGGLSRRAGRRRAQTASGTSSKRSTSTRPRSVILSAGITESARKESVWNGASKRAAERRRGGGDRAARREHLVERRVGEEPGDRQRELGEHLGAVDDDDPAAEFARRATTASHGRVAHADDDDVVRVVGDGRARTRRAAARSRGRSRARSGRSRGGARTRRSWRGRASGSAIASPARHGGLLDERVGDDLPGHEPDHARLAARPRDREDLGAERADAHGALHPVGHGRRRDLADRRARA